MLKVFEGCCSWESAVKGGCRSPDIGAVQPACAMKPLGPAHKLQQHAVACCRWECTVKGGREGRNIDAVELARAVEALGAGEILLNCIDKDGQ